MLLPSIGPRRNMYAQVSFTSTKDFACAVTNAASVFRQTMTDAPARNRGAEVIVSHKRIKNAKKAPKMSAFFAALWAPF